jgi:hypothetical protein
MRKAIVSIIALAVLVWAADRAQAATIRYIGKYSVADVRRGCSIAGGTFSASPDGGGYGCVKNNCDGKGGKCTVACDNNNNCNGETPGRTVPKSVHGVLTGGGQLAPPDTPSNRPPKPVTGQGALGGGILDGGSGFGSQGPTATGAPSGGGAAPPRAQGGGRVN